MITYADIAIPNLPKDTLTYAVPDGLAASIAAGQRVLVPLGRRFVTGYVVRVHGDAPEVPARPLAEIHDLQPAFSQALLDLAAWIARYYVSPLGDVLRAALPQGIDVATSRHAALATMDQDRLAQAAAGAPAKKKIIRALLTGELMSEQSLCAATGLRSVSQHLRALADLGIVRLEAVLDRPEIRPKLINAVRLVPPWTREEKIAEIMELLERRAPKQVNVIAVLWNAWQRGERSLPMAELARRARATTAQIRALEEKELVEVFEEEVTRETQIHFTEKAKKITLTDAQREVLSVVTAAVDARTFTPFLLHGVTASGKTQVYIDAIRHARAQGKSALVLVPEIALTPQLVARFRHAFGKDVAVMHSRMSPGERFDAWRAVGEERCRIVVGVRSAVFAPLRDLGLVVVDEEHETSYKQSDLAPRYHARDVAVMRGAIERAAVLLGSATPSAESWHNAQTGKYRLLRLPDRIDDAVLPTIVPVDMAEERKQKSASGAFSRPLIEGVTARIARRETSIILHNRRGYAPQIECLECGFVEECTNCSIALVYHKDVEMLRCHYCGSSRKAPVVCARCGGTELDHVGTGTQRVEEDLRAAVPGVRVLRMDLDTTRRKGAHDLLLTAFSEGEGDVLLGTQMVAKGLDFPQVTLVGVVAAEQSLYMPDFRAGERTFQLLTQVAGRSGRGSSPGEVVIQSVKPDHPVLQRVYAHDYEGFIEAELESRRTLFYPPFSRLVHVLFSSEEELRVAEAANVFHRALARDAGFYRTHPPQQALLKKINNRWRWQLLVRVDKSRDASGAMMAVRLEHARESVLRVAALRTVRIDIDVDPQQML